MRISSIINKNTGMEVCGYYCNREINIKKCQLEIGKPLHIVYETGSYFSHEKIVDVEYPDNDIIMVETKKKIWLIGGGASNHG